MTKKDFQAALFDLDGVVFNTEPQYTVFWGAQCREFHPKHPGLEQEIKGMTLVQIYDAWFSGELSEKQALITERLNDYEAQMSYNYVAGFEAFTSVSFHHKYRPLNHLAFRPPSPTSAHAAKGLSSLSVQQVLANPPPSPPCWTASTRLAHAISSPLKIPSNSSTPIRWDSSNSVKSMRIRSVSPMH